MTHPFRYEIKSTPMPNLMPRGAHEVSWVSPVVVDYPQLHIGGPTSGMLASVTVAGVPLPGGAPLWVDGGGATAFPGVAQIGVGQMVQVVATQPFTVTVTGSTPNLPGNLPPGTWMSYPDRAGPVEYGYRRVRRVHGLQEGDDVVVGDGVEISVDPQGFLATPVLLSVGQTLHRRGDSPQPGLILIGDLIMPAAEVGLSDRDLARGGTWQLRGATCFEVYSDGSESVYGIERDARAAIQAARAALRLHDAPLTPEETA